MKVLSTFRKFFFCPIFFAVIFCISGRLQAIGYSVSRVNEPHRSQIVQVQQLDEWTNYYRQFCYLQNFSSQDIAECDVIIRELNRKIAEQGYYAEWVVKCFKNPTNVDKMNCFRELVAIFRRERKSAPKAVPPKPSSDPKPGPNPSAATPSTPRPQARVTNPLPKPICEPGKMHDITESHKAAQAYCDQQYPLDQSGNRDFRAYHSCLLATICID